MDNVNKVNDNSKASKLVIQPYVSGYEELENKCKSLISKWQEIKQLVDEIENLELPVKFRHSPK